LRPRWRAFWGRFVRTKFPKPRFCRKERRQERKNSLGKPPAWGGGFTRKKLAVKEGKLGGGGKKKSENVQGIDVKRAPRNFAKNGGLGGRNVEGGEKPRKKNPQVFMKGEPLQGRGKLGGGKRTWLFPPRAGTGNPQNPERKVKGPLPEKKGVTIPGKNQHHAKKKAGGISVWAPKWPSR